MRAAIPLMIKNLIPKEECIMANENLYTNLEQLELLAQRTKDAIPVNVSDLENDSGYQTAAQVEAAINAKVSSVFDYKGVYRLCRAPARVVDC